MDELDNKNFRMKTLSDKHHYGEKCGLCGEDISDCYSEADVKEFIRALKDITKDCMSGGCDEEIVMARIDKLVGPGLC